MDPGELSLSDELVGAGEISTLFTEKFSSVASSCSEHRDIRRRKGFTIPRIKSGTSPISHRFVDAGVVTTQSHMTESHDIAASGPIRGHWETT